MEIDRTSDRPVYKQVADTLRAAIRGGALIDGAPLPSETQLTRRLGVSRNSVRTAMALLRAEGLVATEHGRGTFVRARPRLQPLGSSEHSKASWHPRGSSPSPEGKQGSGSDQQLLGVEIVRPPEKVARRLGLAPAEPVLVRRRLMSFGGQPAQLVASYLPLDLAQAQETRRDLGALGGARAEQERLVEEVTVRMPTPEEAWMLGMREGAPLARVLRTRYDPSGRALEVSDFLLAGDRHVLVYEVPAH